MTLSLFAGCFGGDSRTDEEPIYEAYDCRIEEDNTSLWCAEERGVAKLPMVVESGYITSCIFGAMDEEGNTKLTCNGITGTIETYPVGERIRHLDNNCRLALLANGEGIVTCSNGWQARLAASANACIRVLEDASDKGVYEQASCNGLDINYGAPNSGVTIQANLLGMYDHDAGTFGTLEIPAYDPVTQRIFLVNVLEKSVDIVSIADPSDPQLVGRVDLSKIGEPNSIDIRPSDGLLAIAVHRETDIWNYEDAPLPFVVTKDRPDTGLVYFMDTDGQRLNIIDDLGYQPDMITFTPDGNKVLVANEGQPSTDYKFDPEGSVDIIDVSGPILDVGEEHVTHVTFHAFEEDKASLMQKGIRVNGPGANLSMDFEPEYITVSPDSLTAYVAIQEANAIAVLDVEAGQFTEIMPMGYKPHSSGAAVHTPLAWEDSGITDTSGWMFLGEDATLGTEVYLMLSDASNELHLVDFDPATESLSLRANPLVTLSSEADFEDLAVCKYDGLNAFILAEESIPSLQFFDGQGSQITRLVPENSSFTMVGDYAILPSAISDIETNKGFESVACFGNHLYTMTQSSLSTPGSTEQWIRILDINIDTMTLEGQYLYPVELTDGAYSRGGKMDKVTSMVAIGQGELLVIERDSATGDLASKWVFRVDLSQGTNLMDLDESMRASGVLEQMSMNEFTEIEVDTPDVDLTQTIVNDRILINELASKVSLGPSNPYLDGATDSDYIELYNPTNADINLSGWRIYDDISKAYTFPEGSSIGPMSYLLLFADDTNDGTQDWDMTIDENGAHHLPIKLSSGGESVTLEDNNQVIIENVIFPALSQDTSYGRLVTGSSIFGVTELTPLGDNVEYVGGEGGPSAASQGIKPVLKSPFVELGDRYGAKPEALTIVAGSTQGAFISGVSSDLSLNKQLSLDDANYNAFSQGDTVNESTMNQLEGSGLDYCSFHDAFTFANDGGEVFLIDANDGQVLDVYSLANADFEGVTCDDEGTIYLANEATTQIHVLEYSTDFSLIGTLNLENLPVDLDDGKGLESVSYVASSQAPSMWPSSAEGYLIAGSQDATAVNVYAIPASISGEVDLQAVATIELAFNDVAGLDVANDLIFSLHDSHDTVRVHDLEGNFIASYATPSTFQDTEGIDVQFDCMNQTMEIAFADDEFSDFFIATLGGSICVSQTTTEIELFDFIKEQPPFEFDMTGELRLGVLTDAGATATSIPFGFIDIRLHPLDGSDEDGYNPFPWPVMALYMPDGITSYTVDGEMYLITGNEGDLRDYRYFNSSSGMNVIGHNEEIRIASTTLDPMRFPDANSMQQMSQLGRLNVPNNCGDSDADGDLDFICAVGARSFSIWTTDMEMVWDSGHDLSYYSTKNGQHRIDEMNSRDDNKGIEPEGVRVGVIEDRTYLFVSMERSFGVMIYDISNPHQPTFQQWIQVDGATNPEDMEFIPAEISPTSTPLLVVANEDSGTVGIWELSLL